MNRRSFLKSANAAGLALALPATTFAAEETKTATAAPNPKTILLKDYRPQSIYKVPVTHIDKAKFPIIDMALYALDGLIFLGFGLWLDLAFHAFALFNIYKGLSALNELNQLNRQPAAMAAAQGSIR